MDEYEEIPVLEGPSVRLEVYTPNPDAASVIAEQFARMAVGYADDDMVASVLVVPRHVMVDVDVDLVGHDDA